MRIWRMFLCTLTDGHRWTESRRRPDYYTCVKCRTRRSQDWIAAHPDAIFAR